MRHMNFINDFFAGLHAHWKGIRFAFGNPVYLPLVAIPFLLTIGLYVAAVFMLDHYDDVLLGALWSFDPQASGEAVGYLHTAYLYVVKFVLYLVLFVLMYFLFMVIANIIASPLYDIISGRIRKRLRPGAPAREAKFIRVVLEEIKKAAFVLIIPLLCLLIPVVGAVISIILAMLLIAWDFTDFSMSRDAPRFGERLGRIRKRPFVLLGFGSLLLVPILNFFLFPFAILGGSLLYEERLAPALDMGTPEMPPEPEKQKTEE